MRPDRSRIPGRELAVQVGGDRLVVWLDPGVAPALDAGAVAEGRDVGATGVFVPVADGREVSFERSDDAFVDDKTGSRSNVLGTPSPATWPEPRSSRGAPSGRSNGGARTSGVSGTSVTAPFRWLSNQVTVGSTHR